MQRRALGFAFAAALVTAGSASAAFTNGSFETGDFAGWVTQDMTGPFFPLGVYAAGTADSFGWGWANTPTDGVFSAYHGWDGDGASGGISAIRIGQDVLIDAPTLEFDYRAAWDLTFGGFVDRTFDVNVEVAGGGANLQSDLILTAAQGTTMLDTGPLSGTVDMSAFLGQTVRVSFDFSVPEDFVGPAAMDLDNIRLTGIPGPGALALLGLAGIVARRRRAG
jgi:MYXO-CTERM domain-containing protein